MKVEICGLHFDSSNSDKKAVDFSTMIDFLHTVYEESDLVKTKSKRMLYIQTLSFQKCYLLRITYKAKILDIHKNVAIHGHFMVIGKIYFFDYGKTTTCFITNRTEMK